MYLLRYCIFALLLACLPATAAHADLVYFTEPQLGITMKLQGRTTVLAGGNVSFTHPKFGRLYFGLENVRIFKVDSLGQILSDKLRKAKNSGDAQELMDVADWALRHGLLAGFYESVVEVLRIDPQNKRANQIRDLKNAISEPLPEKPELEKFLRSQVRVPDMKIQRSDHFILMHDTPAEPAEGHKKPRADERLELLETVYESFLLKFYSQGVQLQIPQERLMVVLFNDYEMFKDYATSLSPSLASAAGFWSPDENISFFYDHGSDRQIELLKELAAENRRIAERYKRQPRVSVKNVMRFAKTLHLLAEVAQESSDVEVVSHEATHQMAGNTGLFPRDVRTPSWVHEGLAAYFESPSDAAWAGVGAVNETRLEWYRALASDREHSSVDFIVGDQIFDYAISHGGKLHAYGQAWALTHFLVDREPEKLMQYYNRLGQFPPDTPLSADVLTKLFDEVFGEDHDTLELQWRDYMRDLKTDVEVVLEEAK